MQAFERFIGIDFSGAQGPGLRGLRVAEAPQSSRAVRLIPNPYRKSGLWRRSDLGNWLSAQVRAGQGRVLVGMDLAFGFPYADRVAYFPGLRNGPKTVRELWNLVDRESGGDDIAEFYAGRVYLDDRSTLKRYFLHGTHRGDLYEGRTRVIESSCRTVKGTNPTTVFNLVGPATVGVSSLAGMRLARWLDRELAEQIAFWPFDHERCDDATMVVTEIFPRLYYLSAGEKSDAWRNPAAFNRVLDAYHSTTDYITETEDVGDAIIAAGALRSLSTEEWVWQAPESEARAANFEGWIFGSRGGLHG